MITYPNDPDHSYIHIHFPIYENKMSAFHSSIYENDYIEIQTCKFTNFLVFRHIYKNSLTLRNISTKTQIQKQSHAPKLFGIIVRFYLTYCTRMCIIYIHSIIKRLINETNRK